MRARTRAQIKRIKRSFFQFDSGDSNSFLCSKRLTELVRISGCYRDRIFTPVVTLNLFLWQVLSENGSCKQVVAHLIADRILQNLPTNSFSSGPYCKARQRLSLSWIVDEVRRIGALLHKRSDQAWSWKGLNVLLVDGTTLLMPDTKENQTKYPQQSNQKPGLGFPIARLVGLISLSTGAVMDYAMGEFQGKGTGETSLFSRLLGSLHSNDLLVADRYYCSFGIVMALKVKGAFFLSRNNPQKKADFRTGIKLGKKDHLIEWLKPKRKPVWMTQETYEQLPSTLTVREFAVGGTVYVTSLLDDANYSNKELAALYAERWNVELDFRSLKTDLNMEMLRCKSPEMAEKEVAVRFMAYNLIRANIAAASTMHDEIARRVSFKSALNILDAARTKFETMSSRTFKNAYRVMAKVIVSTLIGNRKRPSQPRAVKRRPKAYPLLTIPRSEACYGLSSNKF